MKNGKLLSDYLDLCEKRIQLLKSCDIARLEEYDRMVESGETDRLHEALLSDGWTQQELDAAYERRLNLKPGYVAMLQRKHTPRP